MSLSTSLLKELKEYPNTTQDTQHPDPSMYHILNELITYNYTNDMSLVSSSIPKVHAGFLDFQTFTERTRINGFFHMANVS